MPRTSGLLISLCLGVLGVVAGCGAPVAGDACSKSGYQCLSDTAAGECRGGRWVEIPCRGSGGCSVSGGQVSCDAHGARGGDACATSQEGSGFCTPANTLPVGAYVCTSGVYVALTCRTCTESGATASCQQ